MGSTTRTRVAAFKRTRGPASKRTWDHDYAHANDLPLSPAFELDFACAPKRA